MPKRSTKTGASTPAGGDPLAISNGLESFLTSTPVELDAARLALARALAFGLDRQRADPDGMSASLVKEFRALLDSFPTGGGDADDPFAAFAKVGDTTTT